MRFIDARSRRRWGALSAVALTSTALLWLTTGNSVGQQSLPEVRMAGLRENTRRGRHAIDVAFSLPARFRLRHTPWVRVTDARGRVVERMPVLITQGPPDWRGHHELHSHRYKPGVYQVSLEIEYRDPQDQAAAIVSAATTLTIPTR